MTSTVPDVLRGAVVYDLECFPNLFSFHGMLLEAPVPLTYEISTFRDDRHALLAFLRQLRDYQRCMVGFNNVGYDYILLHHLLQNPNCTNEDLYALNNRIFAAQREERFGLTVWASDRLIPQVDLYLANHFDNVNKRTSLKALQCAMHSPSVEESPVPFGIVLTQEQIETQVLPYGDHDVAETRRFAIACLRALAFREGLIPQFGIDVLNWSDVKIGARTLEQMIGENVCFYRDANGRRQPRQTPRQRIALNDIIFPYIRFEHPEFQRVLNYMRSQVLTPEDIDNPDATVQTKGVFKGLRANVGGIDFVFGTGGMHGSVNNRYYESNADWVVRDIDVGGLYPAIGVANGLAPAHLGHAFITAYGNIPVERKKHKKGTTQNASLKLAANGGGFGMSNNKYSSMYDPQFTMQTTINGQLLICMLAEQLATIPTLELIQCNTDGITYYIQRDWEPKAAFICKMWESTTGLRLEDVDYSRMWISTVSSYVAETTDGKIKQKGLLWHPDPDDYLGSIANANPPAFHKDLSNIVSIRAAVQAMVKGVDPAQWIVAHRDSFDFMLRARCDRASVLMLGDREMPKTLRYYVALRGEPLIKVSPPVGPEGAYKRANGVSKADYARVMAETHEEWSEAVCTKNKSRYVTRRTGIETGYVVAECNDARRFDWANVNFQYYVEQTRRLIIDGPVSQP